LAKGTEFSEPIHAMDLTATIAAVGGANHRADQPFDGMNVLPALKGERELPSNRPFFFRRFKGRTGHYQQSAVRQGDWKYLRTYKYLGDGKFPDQFAPALYNLKEDIAEGKNLAASHPEKLQTLSDLLDGWEAEMSKTAIPFVPAPRRKK
jgi:arylsulfatase A-like enzyme